MTLGPHLTLHNGAASTKGFAAILGSTWFATEWLELIKQFHITVLEFPDCTSS